MVSEQPVPADIVAVMGVFSLSTVWVYLIAQLAGAVVAALVFKQAHPGE